MKARIEELAVRIWTWNAANDKTLAEVCEEVMTTLAQECYERAAKVAEDVPIDDAYPSFNDDFNAGCYEAAEAIRKLKEEL